MTNDELAVECWAHHTGRPGAGGHIELVIPMPAHGLGKRSVKLVPEVGAPRGTIVRVLAATAEVLARFSTNAILSWLPFTGKRKNSKDFQGWRYHAGRTLRWQREQGTKPPCPCGLCKDKR